MTGYRAHITGGFLKHYMDIIAHQALPYQWQVLSGMRDKNPTVRNFQIAAGEINGSFSGVPYQDTDLAKWLDAVGCVLQNGPDRLLEQTADAIIETIVRAQDPDGYLDTYYQLVCPEKKWTDPESHELYCFGHMIEAGVSYYEGTRKRSLLDVACRLADHVDRVFGPNEGQLHSYRGHEIIEMALMRLSAATGEARYSRLAEYLVTMRRDHPELFYRDGRREGNPLDYGCWGWGDPQRELSSYEHVTGHAVRAMYLYCGMADVARETGDTVMAEHCDRLFHDVTDSQMYITGGIGTTAVLEAYTYPYDLPNDTVYGETCAAIGLCFFARRMFENTKDAKYMDVLERALYNGVISGMSLDGRKFFYVNPLEVLPEACEKDQNKRHVKYERQKWFGCACCPPNVARILSSLGAYAYQESDDTVFMSLFVGGTFSACLGGMHNRFSVTTDYPWDGTVKVKAESLERAEFSYAIRIPAWCADYQVKINGEAVEGTVDRGYLYLNRTWSEGDEIELTLNMPVELIAANPRIREDIGKAVVMRGPLVYCLEEADNGGQLQTVRLDPRAGFEVIRKPELLGGVNVIKTAGKAIDINAWDPDTPYRRYEAPVYKERELTFIPYYSWTNRTPGEMTVWVHTL